MPLTACISTLISCPGRSLASTMLGFVGAGGWARKMDACSPCGAHWRSDVNTENSKNAVTIQVHVKKETQRGPPFELQYNASGSVSPRVASLLRVHATCKRNTMVLRSVAVSATTKNHRHVIGVCPEAGTWWTHRPASLKDSDLYSGVQGLAVGQALRPQPLRYCSIRRPALSQLSGPTDTAFSLRVALPGASASPLPTS